MKVPSYVGTSWRTLLYFRISRTSWLNASSTLMRFFAEVSMNLQPKCFARSRPSADARSVRVLYRGRAEGDVPFIPTCRSYSKSHLFATTMTGNES